MLEAKTVVKIVVKRARKAKGVEIMLRSRSLGPGWLESVSTLSSRQGRAAYSGSEGGD